jgi:hypothetical protein
VFMEKLQNWYKELSKERKIFVYVISFLLLAAFGFGLIPFLVLIYLELGLPNNNAKKIIGYFLGGPIALYLIFMFVIGIVGLNVFYPFVIFFEILGVPIYFFAKKLDNKHHIEQPEDRGYKWGYFLGIYTIVVNLLMSIFSYFFIQKFPGLLSNFVHREAIIRPEDINIQPTLQIAAFGIVISIFLIITAYGVCQRLRIPFIILTIFTFNPVIWVVNYFYIKRRPYLAKK